MYHELEFAHHPNMLGHCSSYHHQYSQYQFRNLDKPNNAHFLIVFEWLRNIYQLDMYHQIAMWYKSHSLRIFHSQIVDFICSYQLSTICHQSTIFDQIHIFDMFHLLATFLICYKCQLNIRFQNLHVFLCSQDNFHISHLLVFICLYKKLNLQQNNASHL
jgi:hypothetical protein